MNSAQRYMLIVGTSIAVALGAFDVYLRATAKVAASNIKYADGYHVRGPLGNGPLAPGTYPSSAHTANGELIYDVEYTIGADGFRAVPGDGKKTYLFYGCSLTFGEGVRDNETLPARFSAAMEHKYRVMSISFHGYGPHQMLRSLELGLSSPFIVGDVARAFYLFIPDHINRAVGFYGWTMLSPRYVSNGAGGVRFDGLFADSWLYSLLDALERASGLPRLISNTAVRAINPLDGRIALTGEIITAAENRIREKLRSTLTVILWDRGQSPENLYILDHMERLLVAQGIVVQRASRFIPDIGKPIYVIRAGVENHPSSIAYDRLGRGLAAYFKD